MQQEKHMLTTHTLIMVSVDKGLPIQGYLDARDVSKLLAGLDAQAKRTGLTREYAKDFILTELSKPAPPAWYEQDKQEILSMVLWVACRITGEFGERAEEMATAGGHGIAYEITSDPPESTLKVLSPPAGNPTTPSQRTRRLWPKPSARTGGTCARPPRRRRCAS